MDNIITRTGHVLDLISQIYENQIENKRIYAAINIYAPFNLCDYDSFIEKVPSLDVSRADIINILKKIYETAKKNVEMRNTIYNSPPETYDFSGIFRRRILEPWDDSGIPPKSDQPHPLEPGDIDFEDFAELEDVDFIKYCEKIEEVLRPIFSDKDQLPKERYTATNAQIAVFFHCMSAGKLIPHPGKSDWKTLILNPKYKFPGRQNTQISGMDIYNLFIRIGRGDAKDPLIIKNIAFCIDHLLLKYPSALRIAEDQLTSQLSK